MTKNDHFRTLKYSNYKSCNPYNPQFWLESLEVKITLFYSCWVQGGMLLINNCIFYMFDPPQKWTVVTWNGQIIVLRPRTGVDFWFWTVPTPVLGQVKGVPHSCDFRITSDHTAPKFKVLWMLSIMLDATSLCRMTPLTLKKESGWSDHPVLRKRPKRALWSSSDNIKKCPRFGSFLGTVESNQPDSFSSVSCVLRHKFWVPTTGYSNPKSICHILTLWPF